jgi:lysozyme
LNFKNLKSRIKKNEGYSNKPYRDQLGFYTIGYGHLIKKKEDRYFHKTFSKKYFENIFELDFKKSVEDYYKNFNKKKHKQNEKELLIEMIYQLGIKNVVKFKRLHLNLEKKQKYMVCLEMIDSLWYKQTPKRVENLIKNFIKK